MAKKMGLGPLRPHRRVSTASSNSHYSGFFFLSTIVLLKYRAIVTCRRKEG